MPPGLGYLWPVPSAEEKRLRRRLVELFCICFAVIQIGWFVLPSLEVVRGTELLAQDKIISVDKSAAHADEVVFIAIDERSLKLDHLWPEEIEESPALASMAETGFPWNRAVYAAALERIFAAGARLVLLDLIFDKPREGDAELAATLEKFPGRVVLAANYSLDEADPNIAHDDIPAFTLPVETVQPKNGPPVPAGYANFWTDKRDPVVRTALYRTTLSELKNERPNPSETIFASLSFRAIELLGLPTDRLTTHRPLAFRFADTSAVPVFPFHSLFVPQEWKQALKDGEALRDKIVIIGPSASRLQDFHVTPVGKIPGPMLHAHALLAAMNNSFYVRAGWLARAGLIALACLVAFVICWRFRRRPVLAFVSLIATAALYVGIVYALAHWADYLLYPIQPTICLLLAGASCTAWNFAQERRESSRMRSTLERYVSRNVVREILDNREDFLNALGGTRRAMTVFFSDVRGFTSFSESADASAVVEQLNEYLGEMVSVIFRHNGTVDKFMGDGIMAVWGNVVSEGAATDARRAVEAALEMQSRLAKLNGEWTRRGWKTFTVGMGLHHGEAVFGNIGSNEKMEPTVIGDTVNLASRVEGLTKKYGVSICITQPLAELVSDTFLLRSVDLVQVVGKSRPVEIFTVVGPRSEEPSEWLKRYEGAIADFRARRFEEAATAFKRCLEENAGDRLCAIHLLRCETFIAEPPPEDWTGTEIATSK